MSANRIDQPLVGEILASARATLERGWCQRAPATTGAGAYVPVEHPFAARWSPIGALQLACSSRSLSWESKTARAALRLVRDAIATCWKGLDERERRVADQAGLCNAIADWNDEAGSQAHAVEVLAVAVGKWIKEDAA